MHHWPEWLYSKYANLGERKERFQGPDEFDGFYKQKYLAVFECFGETTEPNKTY